MLQAIITKRLAPTATKGPRIVAIAEDGERRTMPWDPARSITQNHLHAAQEFIRWLGWEGEWYGGAIKDGYTFVNGDYGPSFTVGERI